MINYSSYSLRSTFSDSCAIRNKRFSNLLTFILQFQKDDVVTFSGITRVRSKLFQRSVYISPSHALALKILIIGSKMFLEMSVPLLDRVLVPEQ